MNELTIERKDTEMTVFLQGEIDHHTARDTREQIDNAIDRFKPRHLFLDLSGVTFMDSSGIGLILGRYRLMQSLEGTLSLTRLSDRTDRLIRLAGLDKLPLRDNRKDDHNETDE